MKLDLSISLSKWFWIALGAIAAIAVVLFLNSTTVRTTVEALTPPELPDIQQAGNRVVLAQNFEW